MQYVRDALFHMKSWSKPFKESVDILDKYISMITRVEIALSTAT